jgi:SSS family solute:Na+ symporter
VRWKRGDLDLLDEWGLGGRRFGTVITWFLLGGDLFTAYTFIAVPALVWAVGAGGFFALPYTIIVFPCRCCRHGLSCSGRWPCSAT